MKTTNSRPKNTAVYSIKLMWVCLFVNVMYIMPYTNTNPANHQLKPKDIVLCRSGVCVCVCVCENVAARLKNNNKKSIKFTLILLFFFMCSTGVIFGFGFSFLFSHWGVNQCVTSLTTVIIYLVWLQCRITLQCLVLGSGWVVKVLDLEIKRMQLFNAGMARSFSPAPLLVPRSLSLDGKFEGHRCK